MNTPQRLHERTRTAVESLRRKLGSKSPLASSGEHAPENSQEGATSESLHEIVENEILDPASSEKLRAALLEWADGLDSLVEKISDYDEGIKVNDHVTALLASGFEAIKQACPEPREVRNALTKVISKCVLDLSAGEIAFVRQRNSDKSLTLIGDPVPNQPETFPGIPPYVKTEMESIALWKKANPSSKGSSHVLIFPDVQSGDPECRTAIEKMRQRLPQNSKELVFVNAIRAEVMLPFYLNHGDIIGVAVAVRQKPYEKAEVEVILDRLEGIRPILESFFAVGGILNEFHFTRIRLDAANTHLPSILTANSDELMYRKISTFLTCAEGTRWHRIMIFLFVNEWPSPAYCCMALGGFGADPGSRWQNSSLALVDRLKWCEAPEYSEILCREDPLFGLTQNGDRPCHLDANTVIGDYRLRTIFARTPLGAELLEDGLFQCIDYRHSDRCHEAPSILTATSMQIAFQGKAGECDHYLLPLLWPDFGTKLGAPRMLQRLGFVIVDNPYVSPTQMEVKSKLLLTRNICNSLAAEVAGRRRFSRGSIDRSCVNDLTGYSANRPTIAEGSAVDLNRNEEVVSAKRIECVVDYFDDVLAHCQARISGLLVPVEFPKDVLIAKGLQPNMHFWWRTKDDGQQAVLSDDITPISSRYRHGRDGDGGRAL